MTVSLAVASQYLPANKSAQIACLSAVPGDTPLADPCVKVNIQLLVILEVARKKSLLAALQQSTKVNPVNIMSMLFRDAFALMNLFLPV